MSAAHSPTPWIMYQQRSIASTYWDIQVADDQCVAEIVHSEEDAAFIVRAVNAHDQLVAAVKAFIKYDSSDYFDDGGQMMLDYVTALEACRAALAAAEA